MAIFSLLNYNPSSSVTSVDVQHRLNMLGEAERMIKCLCLWKAANLKKMKKSRIPTGRTKKRRGGVSPKKYRLEHLQPVDFT